MHIATQNPLCRWHPECPRRIPSMRTMTLSPYRFAGGQLTAAAGLLLRAIQTVLLAEVVVCRTNESQGFSC